MSQEDQQELELASELIAHVIEQHRSGDLRLMTVLNAAIQDIRIGAKYLDAAETLVTRP